jgi:hypothetical protein
MFSLARISDVALKYNAEHSLVAEIPPIVLIESLSSFVSNSSLFFKVAFPVRVEVPVTLNVSLSDVAFERVIAEEVKVATPAASTAVVA